MKAGLSKFILSLVANKWNRQESQRAVDEHIKKRWWQFSSIKGELSERLDRQTGGCRSAYEVAQDRNILPCTKAVSVGCGNARKEIDLVKKGLVRHFDLYELSEERLSVASKLVAELGLTDSFTFNCADVFEAELEPEFYDLVYWDNSLHHMFDVDQAVAWSYKVLKMTGGIIVDDFVGATRFQWSDAELEYARRIRECFVDTEYLRDRMNEGAYQKTTVKRPTKIGMWRDDPSEAADSGKILEALKKYFPKCSVYPQGGVGYHLAVNDILINFDDSSDAHIIKLLMLIDELVSELGHDHYAAIVANKSVNDSLVL